MQLSICLFAMKGIKVFKAWKIIFKNFACFLFLPYEKDEKDGSVYRMKKWKGAAANNKKFSSLRMPFDIERF